MKYKKTLLAALFTPLITLGSGALASAHAAGYAIFTQGASALAQGNAATAHTDDPSTIFYNPALMNRLDGTQLDLGTTIVISSREYINSAPGESPTTNESTFYPSTFYVTHKFDDKVSAGLGVFNPFGLGTQWNSDWDGRYIATKSDLTTFDINPAVCYQLLPSLSVAVGLDIFLADATLERKIPSIALGSPGPDVGQKFKGDGKGVGFNLGLAYDVTKDITFGVSYRSEAEVDIDGTSSTTLGVTPFDSKGKTSIRLPQQLTAGIAYQVTEPLIVELGFRWEGWSAFKDLKLTLDNGATFTTERNWHDTYGLNLGGKYRLNDTVALMAGYVFGTSAVPDSTFDPSIPDADTHVFCVGTDLSFQQFKIGLAYAYQLYDERTKNNSIGSDVAVPLGNPTLAANGRYKSDAHLVSINLGYKF